MSWQFGRQRDSCQAAVISIGSSCCRDRSLSQLSRCGGRTQFGVVAAASRRPHHNATNNAAVVTSRRRRQRPSIGGRPRRCRRRRAVTALTRHAPSVVAVTAARLPGMWVTTAGGSDRRPTRQCSPLAGAVTPAFEPTALAHCVSAALRRWPCDTFFVGGR